MDDTRNLTYSSSLDDTSQLTGIERDSHIVPGVLQQPLFLFFVSATEFTTLAKACIVLSEDDGRQHRRHDGDADKFGNGSLGRDVSVSDRGDSGHHVVETVEETFTESLVVESVEVVRTHQEGQDGEAKNYCHDGHESGPGCDGVGKVHAGFVKCTLKKTRATPPHEP